jgi:hypothetical protein
MNTTKPPNPKIHLYISLVKSVLRIVAGCAIISSSLAFGGGLLVLAEVLGILEELF